jgi:hypothetical protein
MSRRTLTLVSFVGFLAILVPVIAAQPKAGNDDAAQLKAALEERIKVLTRAEEILQSQYKQGTVDFATLVAVDKELCKAELDTYDEPAKRISLLEKHLKKADDLQQITEGRYKSGTVSSVDMELAKADYLNVKIQLLRERMKNNATRTSQSGGK